MTPVRRATRWRLFITTLLALAFSPANAAPPDDHTDDSAAYTSPLAGTEWQLVAIRSMDDSTYEPAERDRYTLGLQPDGSVILRADCNRGRGRWRSDGPGQIAFGPMASTRAFCPPPSLSERYLAQFDWVRSYVLREGHLYLATMADGAIIEFEPVAAPETETPAPGQAEQE